MNEFLTEQLVKRSKTVATAVKKVGLIAATVVSILLGFVHPMLVWVTAIMIIVDIFLFKRMNVEFEYVYFNGDLDIDKIMDMQSRKRVFSTNIKEMEVIAPSGSVELHPYQRTKTLDFSTQNPDDKVYEMVTLFKGETVKVLFNPNEKILNGMKNMAPRKVFF